MSEEVEPDVVGETRLALVGAACGNMRLLHLRGESNARIIIVIIFYCYFDPFYHCSLALCANLLCSLKRHQRQLQVM